MKQTSTGLVLAPILLRFCAIMIDGAIMAVVGLGLSALLGDVSVTRRETYGLVVVVFALYNIGFLATLSATPGKMTMGLYVGDLEGKPLTPDKAILRYVVFFIGGSLLGIGTLISIVLVIVDPQRRAIHDRIAGTIVLAGRAGEPLRPEDLEQRGQGPERPL